MNFQTEHIETDLYHKQKMTTALAIKCDDGIVLASDSQGTTDFVKSSIQKVHEIHKSFGLVGAGEQAQIKDL